MAKPRGRASARARVQPLRRVSTQCNPSVVAELRLLAEQIDAEITTNARPVRKVNEKLFDPAKPAAEAR